MSVNPGWETVDPDLRRIINRVCTPRQIEALQLKHLDWGYKKIGQALGITAESAKGLLDRATLNIQQEVAAMRGIE